MADAALVKCARCGQDYPAEALSFSVAGRVCASCEVDARADSNTFQRDAWRIAMGPFVVFIGTVSGAMFGLAFGPNVIPVFWSGFGLLGLGCAWQAGSWGVLEILDRENGRPTWGAVALLGGGITAMWSFGLIATALVTVVSSQMAH